MRILMVCRKYTGIAYETWSPAGTPAVVKLIEEFEARGHETTVLFLSKDPAGRSDFATNYGAFKFVKFVHIGWRGLPRGPSILSDLINSVRQFACLLPYLLRKKDLFYFDRAHLVFAAVASLFRRRVVWRCLGVMSFVIAQDAGKLAGRLYLAMSRLLVRFPIGLMVCTNDGSPWFRLFPVGSRNRLLLLTNGVDRPAQVKPRSLSDGENPVIAFVGRATIPKGLDHFMQMCAELKRRGVAFSAQVIGDGEFRKKAEETAATNGLSGFVTFLGKVPHQQICTRLSGIDVYVTPARNGAFSNTTLEAIAAGCCVVAFAPDTRTGVDATTMRFIESDVIRWVPRNDANGFAEAVAELLDNFGELQQRSARGIRLAQSVLPTWPERIRYEVDLYEKFVHSDTVVNGAMPSDRLARIAFEGMA